MNNYCAYVHARPNITDASGIFYVGKGTVKRAMNLRRNKHHSNIVNKHGAENILVGKIDCSSEAIAFELEKGLIRCLKRMNVNLTNQTDGGEGISGLNHSEETKKKIGASNSISLKGKIPSKKAFEAARIALTGYSHSEETKNKIGTANRGRIMSQESIKKNRLGHIGQRWITDGETNKRTKELELPIGWKIGRTL